MADRQGWTREQLLVAFNLYCRIPFGMFHSKNPELLQYAERIGRSPSALAMKLSNIASIDPSFTKSGRKGLDGASAADKAMWVEMSADWEGFAEKSNYAISDLGITAAEEEAQHKRVSDYLIDDIQKVDHTGKTKETIVKVRVGQNFFRKSVLSAYNNKCCITGLAIPSLLVASHIVPWSVDPKNRLNPQNGLCLSMLHDKAFDIGMMTINEDMTVRVSEKVGDPEDEYFNSALMSFNGKAIDLPEKFQPNEAFLDWHRGVFFEKWA